MLFLLVLSLTAILGVKCQAEREEPTPECLYDMPFSMELFRVYRSSGKILPSNEFFKESCDSLVENLRCVRDYEKEAGSPDSLVDYDVVVANIEEFCNEESNIRKGYVTHVDCFNSMNITDEPCFSTFRQWAQSMTKEMYETLDERNIHRTCLMVYLLRPCVVDKTKESCGEEAGQEVDDVLDRVSTMVSCNDKDADFFEEIKDELNAKLAQISESN